MKTRSVSNNSTNQTPHHKKKIPSSPVEKSPIVPIFSGIPTASDFLNFDEDSNRSIESFRTYSFPRPTVLKQKTTLSSKSDLKPIPMVPKIRKTTGVLASPKSGPKVPGANSRITSKLGGNGFLPVKSGVMPVMYTWRRSYADAAKAGTAQEKKSFLAGIWETIILILEY